MGDMTGELRYNKNQPAFFQRGLVVVNADHLSLSESDEGEIRWQELAGILKDLLTLTGHAL